MRISVKLNKDAEMDLVSSFTSKRAFVKSPIWTTIKERNLGGTLKVSYAAGYSNEFPFHDFDEMKVAYDAGTESELVNEFTKSKV